MINIFAAPPGFRICLYLSVTEVSQIKTFAVLGVSLSEAKASV